MLTLGFTRSTAYSAPLSSGDATPPVPPIATPATATPLRTSDPSPAPSVPSAATESPSPSPSPVPSSLGFSISGSGSDAFIDHATRGPGQTPPEGPAFAAGDPLSPISPYDWFSSAPVTPGVAGQLQYEFTGAYRTGGIAADASFVVSGLTGDVTNAIYWGEPFVGPIDPHEGRSSLPYLVHFPTHAGTNDVTAGDIVTPYLASLHAADDRWRVTAGYVTPLHYDTFVFTPPALTSVTPSMNLQTFESLGPAIADLDSWNHITPTLPLLGADAEGRIGRVTLEATDALLPGPSGVAARLVGGTAVLDLGDGGRFSFGLVHVATHGDPIDAPLLFGANPTLHPSPQGDLVTSTLTEQRQTIAGLRAFFHPIRAYDALVEFGRSWYDATSVARPGTARPGTYQHFGLTRDFDKNDAFGVEYYRMDPRYATTALPYGILENIWGNPWQYPAPWLKGSYQLVNDNFNGSNRVGFRVHGDLTRGRLETHAALYAYHQLFPSTYDNLTQTGFVEVDYLVLRPGNSAIGHTHGIDAYAAWHFDRDVLSLDYAHDFQHRNTSADAPGDLVAVSYPQLVLAEQHHFSNRLIGAAGYGRYAVAGIWSTAPVGTAYGLGFVGTEWDFGNGQQLFVQLRAYGLAGLPSISGGPSPNVRGTSIVVDHHIRF